MSIADTTFDSLVQQVLADPGPRLDRLIRALVQRATPNGAGPSDETNAPRTLIAESIGRWIEEAADGASALPPEEGEVEHVENGHTEWRVTTLAAALGACDCWGEELHCPFCEGYGVPGWVTPDRRLFAEFVYPAVRAFSIHRARTNGATRDRKRENR